MIHFDVETYSEADLLRVGQFRYAQDVSTDLMVGCYLVGSTVHVWLPCIDPTKHRKVIRALQRSPHVVCDDEGLPLTYKGGLISYGRKPPVPLVSSIKRGDLLAAHNAGFEYCIWEFVVRRDDLSLPPLYAHQLQCSSAQAAYAGWPRSLEGAGSALGLRIRKAKKGKRLLYLFCKPHKLSRKKEDTRIKRVYPEDEPYEFIELIDYCRTDVLAEKALTDALPPMPEFERRIYAANIGANIRGLPVDVPLISAAREVVQELERRNRVKVRALTKGINPTQVQKLKAYIEETFEVELDDLKSNTLRRLLRAKKIPALLQELVTLRIEAARVSTRKLDAMLRVVGADSRLRGTTMYYGAHTGRDSSKLVQVHNLVRGLLPLDKQAAVFRALRNGDADLLELLFQYPLEAISQCVRGFIRAAEGAKLMIADYSAIEAKVLAWLAGDEEMLEAYRKGADTYLMMAAKLFRKHSYEELVKLHAAKNKKVAEWRRMAKNVVLGCGFSMSGPKFVLYCANQDIDITDEFGNLAVATYRRERKTIVDYWYEVERAAIAAVEEKGKRFPAGKHVSFVYDGTYLRAELPSGRAIRYPRPKVDVVERFGKPKKQLSYRTLWKNAVWIRTTTYGGKLVENITQGVARDILYTGVLNAEAHKFFVINCVHDEAWTERSERYATEFDLKQFTEKLCQMPSWANGCPVSAEGFVTDWYRKG